MESFWALTSELIELIKEAGLVFTNYGKMFTFYFSSSPTRSSFTFLLCLRATPERSYYPYASAICGCQPCPSSSCT